MEKLKIWFFCDCCGFAIQMLQDGYHEDCPECRGTMSPEMTIEQKREMIKDMIKAGMEHNGNDLTWELIEQLPDAQTRIKDEPSFLS